MIERVYKIICIIDDKYMSSSYNNIPSKIAVEYKIGEKTYPSIGYLMAFKTAKRAKEIGNMMKYRGCKIKILRCKADVVKKNSPDQMLLIHMWETIKSKKLVDFWKRFESGEKQKYETVDDVFTSSPFRGTVFCRWIKPEKEIELI